MATNSEKPKGVRLNVGELTSREDFGRGIVRISAKDMKNVGIIEGDVVEIEGKRKTAAIAVRAYPADVGMDIIRMDGLERRNCKAGISEPVEIRKAEVSEAKTVTIAPARKGIIIHMGGNILKQNMLMRPVVTGDIIIPNPIVRNRRSQSAFFEDFFGMDFGDFLFAPFGEEKFVVVSTDPKGIVRITKDTEVELLPQATRPFEEEKIQVPEVTYEDLGGLHEEIGKVREMIELPLKHPEIFERLGIEPPKGVLLHGPPGCGKTLLAKAVANESGARFYVINGPEIMCVDGETKIFTNPKGYVKAKDIFNKKGMNRKEGKIDIVELEEPITTFGVGKDNKIIKTKITHAAKLKAPSYKVVLGDGNEITASHNQPFLVYENGELKWKRVAELKEGTMVARINKLDLPEESYNIDVKGIENIETTAAGSVLKSKNLSRSNVIKLPSKTSPELLEFLGFIVSEGYISEDGITFSNYDKKLRTRFKNLMRQLFGIEKTKEYKDGRVVVYSKLLVKYLELLGFTGKNKVRIPEYFYTLPKNEITSFIRGYFEGDGTVSRTGQYPTPVIYSANREFLQEFQPLLQLKLDIRTILRKHNTPKGLMHKLVVKGNESRRKFSCIGFITEKGNKLNKIQKIEKPHSENIPHPELLISQIKTELPYKDYRNLDFCVYRSGDFTKHALKKLSALLEKKNIINNSVLNEIELLSRDDIAWEKITNIEFIGEQELYDFTVDKDNFVGPNMILLHNSKFYGESEENLRKVFDEAEKNAPSIIFIDEIDAIAPKREEVRGEVEKRVVSQMLCLHPETKIYLPDSSASIGELYGKTEGKTIKDEHGVENKIPKDEFYVQALNNAGKISKAKVIAMSKTPIKQGYKVGLDNGGQIISSEITKFLSISDEGIKWKPANEIATGDHILMPRKLDFSEQIQKIDIFKLKEKEKWVLDIRNTILARLLDKNFVALSDVEKFLRTKEIPAKSLSEKVINYLLKNRKSTKQELECEFGVTRKALNNCLRTLIKRGVIAISSEDITIAEINREQIAGSIRRIAYKDDKKIYPIKNKYFMNVPAVIDEQLAKFLSLVMTDGNIRNYRVNISGETSYIAKRIGESLFGLSAKTGTINGTQFVNFQSRALGEFLSDCFSISKGRKSHNIRVPSQIFASPKSVRASFIAGLIEGDGSIGQTQVRYHTKSKKMALDSINLMASVGLLAGLKNYNVYTVQVYGGSESFRILQDCVGKFIELERKKFALEKLTQKMKNFSKIVYPVKSLLKNMRDRYSVRLDDSKYRYLSPNLSYQINSNVLGYFIEKLEGIENVLIEEIKQVYASEVIPVMVTDVETVQTEIMYDLTTEYSNFLAGDIPVVVHNTLMDGLKSRGKLIVIGATNIPNALDPALRRPGRFDREIEVGVPNAKGRKEILQIHTRGMPLFSFSAALEENEELTNEQKNMVSGIWSSLSQREMPTEQEIEKGIEKYKKEKAKTKFDEEQTKKIIVKLLKDARVIRLENIAAITYGYVGADISALCKEGAMHAMKRVIPDFGSIKEDKPIPPELLKKLVVTKEDFDYALKMVEPSAMREVLIEIPTTKWEDIGGLEDEKASLKESIEWPMKYPDSFKTLGIKPPAGILLYGPPGCGKTLLAKAVANESGANFIAIKGPELLCVSSDTKILTSHCGATAIEKFYNNIIPISEIVEQANNYEVRKLKEPVYTFGIGQNGEAIKTKVEIVHKLWVDDAYTVRLENNAKLTGSANQPLMAFKNNSLEWVALKGIKEGDYIAYPRRLGTLNQKVLIPLPNHKHLRIVKEDDDAYYVRIFSSKSVTRLPKTLTKNLAAFLGWFVSEGNVSKEAITICNSNKENQREIISLFEQFVDKCRIKVYEDRVVAYSTPLVKYLEYILEQPLGQKKSYTINCPSMIAKASKDVIVPFLRAAYKGDGSISKTRIEYGSKSSACVEGFTYLLAILGVKSKYWTRKDKMHMLTISGKKEMQLFKNIVLGDDKLLKIRDEYNAQYKLPPVAALLKKIKENSGLTYDKEVPDGSFEHIISGRRKLGLIRLQKLMDIFEKCCSDQIKQSKEFTTLRMIAKGDFLWTKVTSIVKAEPQLMYDVETETHAFVGGNIPLLLHNSMWVGESEKHIREVFRRAKQVAPSIIFFDELDSLVPKRGSSMDGHAVERVESQLLTEMSGLEDLHDVVVMGATNRPDLIDAALLRPGRFERQILVPTPDEDARLKILSVHTKDMPLAKDVNLKLLSKETDGFSGADLDALVREAGLNAMRKNMSAKEVPAKDFEKALKEITPSVSKDMNEFYEAVLKKRKTQKIDESAMESYTA